MPGMWGAVIMVIVSGHGGGISAIPFYDGQSCQSAQAEMGSRLPYGSRTFCVPTVQGNPGMHNGH
jgi:hypothetical protein